MAKELIFLVWFRWIGSLNVKVSGWDEGKKGGIALLLYIEELEKYGKHGPSRNESRITLPPF